MQTILGAGGAIGNELAYELKKYTGDIRLVSRDPSRINPDDELFPADLSDSSETLKAIEGSDIAYLTVGLPYKIRVWEELWPKIMENVIQACMAHGTRLVFFDNVYMYDPEYMDNMTEETPINPISKKGNIRAKILQMLLDRMEEGSLQALIARSADFYGPGIEGTSVLTETVLNNLSKGKKANWLGSADCMHSYTFVPDAGEATALLGNTEDAYNQTWHLPTAPNPPTGREWIGMIAEEMGVKPRYRELPKWVVKLAGMLNSQMRELAEMMYQNDRDYIFDSSKFNRRFNYTPTPYIEGIRKIVAADYQT